MQANKQTSKQALTQSVQQINQKQIDRQKKVAKRVERFLKTGKGIRKRALSTGGFTKTDKVEVTAASPLFILPPKNDEND